MWAEGVWLAPTQRHKQLLRETLSRKGCSLQGGATTCPQNPGPGSARKRPGDLPGQSLTRKLSGGCGFPGPGRCISKGPGRTFWQRLQNRPRLRQELISLLCSEERDLPVTLALAFITLRFQGGSGGTDRVGLSLWGGGREARGGCAGTPPPAPFRRDGFVPTGVPPSSVSAPPVFLTSGTPPAKSQLSWGWRSPRLPPPALRLPRPPAAGRSGLGLGLPVGGPGRVRGAGRRARRVARRGPLGRSRAILGATPAPAGPRLLTAARGGRGRPSGTRCFPRRRQAHPLPAPGQPLPRTRRRRPGPRPVPAGRDAPSGSIFQV